MRFFFFFIVFILRSKFPINPALYGYTANNNNNNVLHQTQFPTRHRHERGKIDIYNIGRYVQLPHCWPFNGIERPIRSPFFLPFLLHVFFAPSNHWLVPDPYDKKGRSKNARFNGKQFQTQPLKKSCGLASGSAGTVLNNNLFSA